MFHKLGLGSLARRCVAGALAVGMAFGGVAANPLPVRASDFPLVEFGRPGPLVSQVRDRRWRNDRRWRHHHRHRPPHRHHRSWVGPGLGGLAAGVIIGGMLAAPPVRRYGEPRVIYQQPRAGYPRWSPGWYASCEARYRSFDRRSGTYLGYDGRRHYCR